MNLLADPPSGIPARTSPAGSGRTHRVRRGALGSAGRAGLFAGVVFFLLGAVWAFATPLGGAPDEGAHLTRAASLVRGQILPSGDSVLVPVRVPPWTVVNVCYAFAPDKTANCPQKYSSAELVPVVTSAGRYPPAYYALVGWPSLFLSGPAAWYASRVLTAALTAALLGCAVASASMLSRRGPTLLGLSVAVTPMLMFFSGAVNPQALEISAAAGVWISGGVIALLAPALDRWTLVRFAVSTCALALCRPLSVVWLAIALGAVGLAFGKASLGSLTHQRRVLWTGAAIAAAAILAVGWVLGANALLIVGTPDHSSLGAAIDISLRKRFGEESHFVGVFGWLDTGAPGSVYTAWWACIAFLAMLGLAFGRLRERLAIILVTISVVLIPTAAEVLSHEKYGFQWQGRYILPVAIGVPILCGLVMSSRASEYEVIPRPLTDAWSRGRLVVVVLLATCHFLAFAQALKRYGVGASSHFPWVWESFRWAPPGGVALSLTSCLFAVLLFAWWALPQTALDPPSSTWRPRLGRRLAR